MKNIYALSLMGVVALGFGACNNNTSQDSVSAAREANDIEDTTTTFRTVPDLGIDAGETFSDADFTVEAANAGLFEVQLGKIAADRALNQEVKDFASMMIDDHGTANQELIALAEAKDIVLPTVPGEDKVKTLRDFNEKSTEDFDEDYMEQMIEDHESTIRIFERASQRTADEKIKAFADKQLTILNKHLQAAENLKEKLN